MKTDINTAPQTKKQANKHRKKLAHFYFRCKGPICKVRAKQDLHFVCYSCLQGFKALSFTLLQFIVFSLTK